MQSEARLESEVLIVHVMAVTQHWQVTYLKNGFIQVVDKATSVVFIACI